MEAIRYAITATLATDHPMTVRQVFYRLTSEGVIAKTEAEYKGTVCRLLAEMRRSGEIPYTWLADATRWMRKPTTYSSMEEALNRTAATYRRALWDDAPVAVELWLEKEALAGVLVDVTDEWDVPLMVTRGYPSMSFLHSAAATIKERHDYGQHTHIYYFGDRDPSGVDIDRAVVEGLMEGIDSMRPMAEDMLLEVAGAFDDEAPHSADLYECLTFERVAVTEEQVADWDLPTRPTKRTDTRSKGFKGESVELDAIPAQDLCELAREAIERHVDQHQLSVLRTVEQEERRDLERLAEGVS
jgi:hypothetical protein